MDPKKTPRVPKAIRREAKYRLKHFPWNMDIMIRDDDGKFQKIKDLTDKK